MDAITHISSEKGLPRKIDPSEVRDKLGGHLRKKIEGLLAQKGTERFKWRETFLAYVLEILVCELLEQGKQDVLFTDQFLDEFKRRISSSPAFQGLSQFTDPENELFQKASVFAKGWLHETASQAPLIVQQELAVADSVRNQVSAIQGLSDQEKADLKEKLGYSIDFVVRGDMVEVTIDRGGSNSPQQVRGTISTDVFFKEFMPKLPNLIICSFEGNHGLSATIALRKYIEDFIEKLQKP